MSKKVPVTTHSMPAKIWLSQNTSKAYRHKQIIVYSSSVKKKFNFAALLKLLNLLFNHLHQAKLLHFNETDYKNGSMIVYVLAQSV